LTCGLPLQCGHDPKAVENPPISSAQHRQNRQLQCGHDPKAVENLRKIIGNPLRGKASMRPRPEGRGEQRKGKEGDGPAPSFNAATTRRPWRTCAPPYSHFARWMLQCGHDPKAVENLGNRSECLVARRASMRPRPEGRGERKKDPVETPAQEKRFNAATTRRPWRTTGNIPLKSPQ